MMLLVDVGNTRVKWATRDAGGLAQQHAAAHADWSLGDVNQHLIAPSAVPERIFVSNVGGARMAGLLTAAAMGAWGITPIFVHAAAAAGGVRNAYSEPAKLGVDRWLAMIAAHAMAPSAVCVVSVGTAMTIDGVDAAGRHLGGLITPGPRLMVQSLLGGTSDIAARAGALQLTDAVFATDTATAIHNGARQALAALIMRASSWIHAQVHEQPVIVLTGGASALVDTLLPQDHRLVPDLVLRGLAIVANGQ